MQAMHLCFPSSFSQSPRNSNVFLERCQIFECISCPCFVGIFSSANSPVYFLTPCWLLLRLSKWGNKSLFFLNSFHSLFLALEEVKICFLLMSSFSVPLTIYWSYLFLFCSPNHLFFSLRNSLLFSHRKAAPSLSSLLSRSVLFQVFI